MSVTEQIKARLDLLAYADRYVPNLKKSGKYFKACCPFHEEKTPSFVINAEQDTWYCYGACATGGDIFTFYQTLHHTDFKDALHELAREAGVIIQKYSKNQQVQQDEQRQYDLLTSFAQRFHATLCETDEAWFVREYLKNRNLTSESINQWQLGYVPNRNIITELIEEGYRRDDLLELGIAVEADNGQLRSRFYNRLMFPISNPAGQVVGFGARTLGKHHAKYINSSESKLFKKSNVFYGWHHAKQGIRDDKKVVIVEGYMDVIQAHQAGYTNVVGQMGTMLTEGQIGIIQDNAVPSVLLCLDGDNAGQEATDRAIDTLVKYAQTKDIRIVKMPRGYDPDEVIQSGDWEKVLSDAVTVTYYLIDRYSSKLPRDATLAQRHAVVNELIPKLYQLETDTSRMWAVQQLAFHLDLNEQALVKIAHRLMNVQEQLTTPTISESVLHPEARKFPLEAYIIACLLEHPNGYRDIQAAFAKMDVDMLNRTDFTAFGDLYEQVVTAIETDGFPSDMVEFDAESLSDVEPLREDMVYNAVRLRFNQIEQRLRDVMQLRDIDKFNVVLYERETLREQMELLG